MGLMRDKILFCHENYYMIQPRIETGMRAYQFLKKSYNMVNQDDKIHLLTNKDKIIIFIIIIIKILILEGTMLRFHQNIFGLRPSYFIKMVKFF